MSRESENNNNRKFERVDVRLPKSTIKKVDNYMRAMGLANRSEAIRGLLSIAIKTVEKEYLE